MNYKSTKKRKASANDDKRAFEKVLRSTGLLLPITDDEVESFNKIHGDKQVELPEKLKFENIFPECEGAKCKINNCLICKNEQY